jgi:intracellular septation protein
MSKPLRNANDNSRSAQPSPLTRLATDMGPLVLFFASFEVWGIYAATGVFMAAVLSALAFGYWREKRIMPMPLFTAILVIIFGGLTLYLKDETFIKMKPTALYTAFGLLLVGGLKFDRLFIKYVFDQAFELTDRGWRKLTWRWGFFFFALAILNEAVWRNFSTGTWVDFKVFGILPLTFLFALAQTPMLMKHQDEDADQPQDSGPPQTP